MQDMALRLQLAGYTIRWATYAKVSSKPSAFGLLVIVMFAPTGWF
jgi:hypothetical protein